MSSVHTASPMKRFCSIAIAVATLFGHLASTAQTMTLPSPAKNVYRCESEGKVSYSDTPCMGGQRVDVEPTRGVSRLSGKERVGADVARERHEEALSTAMKPLTGMTAAEFEVATRRQRLTPKAREECYRLDAQIAAKESVQAQTLQAKRARELFEARSRFRDLRC